MTEPTDTVPEPDVDSIRKRADAATPGPWEAGRFTAGDDTYIVIDADPRDIGEGVVIGPEVAGENGIHRENDATFIANARTDIPALLDALATVRGENESHRGKHPTAERIEQMHTAISAERAEGAYKQGHDEGCYICAQANVIADREATITQLRGELSSKNEALAGLLKYAEAVASGFGIIERLPAGHPIRVARAALSTVETPPETFDNGYFTTDVEERKDGS